MAKHYEEHVTVISYQNIVRQEWRRDPKQCQ